MTDEGHACTNCQRECDGHFEYRYGDKWYSDEQAEEAGLKMPCEQERWVCEDGTPAELVTTWMWERE